MGKQAFSARETAVMGLLSALLFGAKMVMAPLPNIEPVSLLVIVYTVVLGLRALIPVYVYVLLEITTWGLGYWSIYYLYVWAVLALAALLLRKMQSPLGWAALSGAFGLCFGALCALSYWVAGGWAFALSWWVSGIPFDLLHGAGNFALALFLFKPCRTVLSRLYYGRAEKGAI
ncbi:MAG: hypothetical protein K2N78_09465 [Oscillospiraceae bacterium]|nr:hypothetical protein [Oscillospiraceae bacterium]